MLIVYLRSLSEENSLALELEPWAYLLLHCEGSSSFGFETA